MHEICPESPEKENPGGFLTGVTWVGIHSAGYMHTGLGTQELKTDHNQGTEGNPIRGSLRKHFTSK